MLRLVPWASELPPRRDLHASQTLWNMLLLKQVKGGPVFLNPGQLITNLNSSLSYEAMTLQPNLRISAPR